MIGFIVAAAVLVLVALAFVLPPLLKAPKDSMGSEREANLAVHRQRLRELQAERDSGALAPAAYEEAKAELERQLLEELRPEQAAQLRPARRTALVVALAVPLLAGGVYLTLGSYRAWLQPAVPPADDVHAQVEFIRQNVDRLQARVEEQPDDLDAWLMLGRSYVLLQRYADAVAVLERAQAHFGEVPQVLAERAEAVAYASGGDLQGQAKTLLLRALELDPANPKALWLAGLSAAQGERPAEARQYWQRLLDVLPPESGAARQIRGLMAELGGETPEALAAVPTARLTVEVRLAPALAERAPPEATVFILARAAGDGPKAPLAVARRQVKDLPTTVQLDDTMGMVPGMTLAEFPEVVLEARVSRNGDAIAVPGDPIGRSAPVKVGAEAPVVVEINGTVP